MNKPKLTIDAVEGNYSMNFNAPTHSAYWYQKYIGEVQDQPTIEFRIFELVVEVRDPEGLTRTFNLQDVAIKGNSVSRGHSGND